MGLSQSLSKHKKPHSEIYVAISKKYVPTVVFRSQPTFSTLIYYGPYCVTPKCVTTQDTLSCHTDDEYIITTLENATNYIFGLFYTGHNTTADFMSPGIRVFGSPVFFELTDEFDLNTKLKLSDVNLYMDTQNIPLHQSFTGDNKLIVYQHLFDQCVSDPDTSDITDTKRFSVNVMICKRKINKNMITKSYYFDAYGKLVNV